MESLQNDREFLDRLSPLRRTDNHTNFLYIGRTWLVIILALGNFIAFDLYRSSAGWHWLWDAPFFLIALVVIGASQHQLAGAGHEATHRTLFRDRWLNEFISDCFCMFPILTTTATYRKQHLDHHLHVNDPGRDPDLQQLQASGHDSAFPMTPRKLAVHFIKQLWPPNLVRYTIHRVRYSAIGVDREHTARPMGDRLFFLYFFVFLALMGILAHLEMAPKTILLAGLTMAGLAIGLLVATSPAPNDSVYPPRIGQLLRYGHVTLLIVSATLIHLFTGLESLAYLALLWFLPLGTTFSYFMMLRQTIQHANCGRGKLDNTRVFLVNPLLRYAIFPLGMDYHLPHHLYASVPHYRLPELHQLLLERSDYGESSRDRVTEGFFRPRSESHSSIIEVLATDSAPPAKPD